MVLEDILQKTILRSFLLFQNDPLNALFGAIFCPIFLLGIVRKLCHQLLYSKQF